MHIDSFAKGGGGHSSGGGRSSSSSRSSSGSSKSSSGSSKSSGGSSSKNSSKSSATTTKTKPGDTIKTADGKTVNVSTNKPSNPKYSQQKGVTGQDGYTPKFNGYSAPAGSVVYYPSHSFLDYLPWIYLFSNNNSPRMDSATVVQPDGKQVQAQPNRDGTDGLAIFSWILLVLIALAIIAGIVYIVNKFTNKGKKNEHK